MEARTTHCKVAFNDEIRRFSFCGNSYHALYQLVSSHFGLTNNKGFQLRYIDEEGDPVTISSDEELNYGLGYLKDNILRLKVELLDGSSVVERKVEEMDKHQDPMKVVEKHDKHDKQYDMEEAHVHEYSGRGGKWRGGGGGRGGRGRGGGRGRRALDFNKEEDEDNSQYKFRLQKKKEKFESMISTLQELDENKGKIEVRQKRISNLKEKLNIVNIKLDELEKGKFDDVKVSKESNNNDEGRKKKWDAKDKDGIRKIKEDIDEKKLAVFNKKSQIREENDNSKKSVLRDELFELKNEHFELKKKLVQLKQQSNERRKC